MCLGIYSTPRWEMGKVWGRTWPHSLLYPQSPIQHLAHNSHTSHVSQGMGMMPVSEGVNMNQLNKSRTPRCQVPHQNSKLISNSSLPLSRLGNTQVEHFTG